MDVAAAVELQPKMPGLATLPRSRLAAVAALALVFPVALRTGLPRAARGVTAVRPISRRKLGVVESTNSEPVKECTAECPFKSSKDLEDLCEEL